MKFAIFLPLHRVTVLLLTLGLTSYQPGSAHQLAQPSTPPTGGLRVISTPQPGSAILRVRYESADYGSVRLRLRDAQNRVLYTELKRLARFAGDYDLSSLPAGNYTLELQTPGSSYSTRIRLNMVVALVVLPTVSY
ncbi:MAG: T9SS type A sorting domain-containing protein [Hymenobacter sp.]|nr:MAG: T9SS type A sorting domain-containing protein [Hymenobacter sp.]